MYQGDTFSNGLFMTCFALNIYNFSLKKRFGEVGFNLSSKDVLKARGQKRIVTAMSGNGVCRFNFPACCYKNFLAIYLYTFHNFHKWISNIYALYLM